MEYIIVPINNEADYNTFRIVVKEKFQKVNDWGFLQSYFYQPIKEAPGRVGLPPERMFKRISSFTHLGIGKDGMAFPTTKHDTKIPSQIEVPAIDLMDNIDKLDEKGDALTKEEVTALMEQFVKTPNPNDVHVRLNNAIRYIYGEKDSMLMASIVGSILIDGGSRRMDANKYAPVVCQIIAGEWHEHEHKL